MFGSIDTFDSTAKAKGSNTLPCGNGRLPTCLCRHPSHGPGLELGTAMATKARSIHLLSLLYPILQLLLDRAHRLVNDHLRQCLVLVCRRRHRSRLDWHRHDMHRQWLGIKMLRCSGLHSSWRWEVTDDLDRHGLNWSGCGDIGRHNSLDRW